MSIITLLRDCLTDPRIKNVDINGTNRISIHREILLSKRLMIEVFEEFYRTCMDLDKKYFTGNGLRIEIGSGSGLFKQYYPEVITTDIEASPYIDRVLDAQDMDFEDFSIHAIYGINCFHHFPQPEEFFKELIRVLKPGGGCILIEPHYGIFSTVVHKHIHTQEHFNKNQRSWQENSNIMSTMSGANQALSYVVFVRDREIFYEKYPCLEIMKFLPIKNPLLYLLSGGLNFRQLIPSSVSSTIRFLEAILIHLIGPLHHAIVIRKRFTY
jgi:SAM-dependent methyltransferase